MPRFAFAAVLALVLAGVPSLPAQAGHYDVVPTSGSGSITVTPLGGSPTITQWTALDNLSYLSPNGFAGSISFSYSEEWYYYWVPDYTGDEPTSQSYPLSGTTTMEFAVTSSSQASSGSANASVTMFGVTYSASGTSTPHDPDPPTFVVSGAAGAAVPRTGSVTLSGAEGTFSLAYSGSASTDANYVMTVNYGFARTSPVAGGPPRIVITEPMSNLSNRAAGLEFDLKGNWWYGSPVAGDDMGVLLKLDSHDGQPPKNRKQAFVTYYATRKGGKWSTKDTITTAGLYTYYAYLQKKNAAGELTVIDPDFVNNPDDITIMVD